MEETQNNEIQVSYQNKDISSKYLASMHGDAFAKVLGLPIAPLKRSEPTELPAIEVSDMMMDNLFLLTDGSYVIIDYESEYSEENMIKYLGYVARLMKRLYNRDRKVPVIQVAVIYTADVNEGQTKDVLDWEYGQIVIKEAFITGWDTEGILADIENKVKNKIPLMEEDQIRLIMVPLSVKGDDAKNQIIRRCIDIIKMIDDDKPRLRMFAGLIAFTDKIIGQNELEEIRRIVSMTRFEKMLYDEEAAAVNKRAEAIAENLLRDGYSVESVSKNTELDISVVKAIAERIKDPVSV